MKPNKALSIVLALILLAAPILVFAPHIANALYVPGSPVYFEIDPVAVPTLTDTNPLINQLETPGTPSPVGKFFDVSIYIQNATLVNVPNGVKGISVAFNFTDILYDSAIPAAVVTPVSFIDELGTGAGAALVGPQGTLLYGLSAGWYDNLDNPVAIGSATQYEVSAASTKGPWNDTTGLVAIVRFQIIAQPSFLLSQPNFGPITMSLNTGSSDIRDALAAIVDYDILPGTLTIDAAPPVYPVAPSVYILPSTFTGPATMGATFNYTVMINADPFWDVAGFDITVTWNDTLLNLVDYSLGKFLPTVANLPTFNITPTIGPGILNFIATKLSDTVVSSGVGELIEMEFNVTFVGDSFPPATCPIALGPTDLASWAHPERLFAPWYGSIAAADLFPFPGWSVTNAVYIAPYVTPGPSIDLYTQYPAPYGGQGPNAHSDSFAPQAEVCLYAKVTYGGDRVTNKLVAFQINDALGHKVTILQNYTDANGIATVCFRLPQTDTYVGGEDPSIFGWWSITATVEVDQVVVNDTMAFQVGWLAQVLSVYANNAPYHKYTNIMNFTAIVLTIHEQPITVLLSVDAYDTAGYPIGEIAWWATINATRIDGVPGNTTNGVYEYGDVQTIMTYTLPPYVHEPIGSIVFADGSLDMSIPTWARVGTASVVGYALTGYPVSGGTPYGPQSNAATEPPTFAPTDSSPTLFTIKIP